MTPHHVRVPPLTKNKNARIYTWTAHGYFQRLSVSVTPHAPHRAWWDLVEVLWFLSDRFKIWDSHSKVTCRVWKHSNVLQANPIPYYWSTTRASSPHHTSLKHSASHITELCDIYVFFKSCVHSFSTLAFLAHLPKSLVCSALRRSHFKPAEGEVVEKGLFTGKHESDNTRRTLIPEKLVILLQRWPSKHYNFSGTIRVKNKSQEKI